MWGSSCWVQSELCEEFPASSLDGLLHLHLYSGDLKIQKGGCGFGTIYWAVLHQVKTVLVVSDLRGKEGQIQGSAGAWTWGSSRGNMRAKGMEIKFLRPGNPLESGRRLIACTWPVLDAKLVLSVYAWKNEREQVLSWWGCGSLKNPYSWALLSIFSFTEYYI